jgi:mRNA interferase RelE/StbE
VAYRIELTPKAADEFRALPRPAQARVLRWLDLLAEDPRRPGTKQLVGRPDLRRVHASKDYVVVYTIYEKQVLVLVVRVAHRKEVYRGL